MNNRKSNKILTGTSQADGPEIVVYRRTVDPFSKIPNAALSDKRMSWRAKGILAYLLGRPAGWRVRMADLINQSKEGRDCVKAAMRELSDCGYADLQCHRDTTGRITGKRWCVSDTPIHRPPEKPSDGKTVEREISLYNKKELSKKENTKKDTLSRTSFPVGKDDVYFSEDEIRIIDHYHRTCGKSGLGFRRITTGSDELSKVLDTFQDHDFETLDAIFQDAIDSRRKGGKDRTLVRILWSNY